MKVNCPLSIGELVDKTTILEIKSIKITDTSKRKEVFKEKTLLQKRLSDVATEMTIRNSAPLALLYALKADLYEVNFKLWSIEDKIRACEKNKDFSDNFVALARAVYKTNDERFEIKNKINNLTNSSVREVESYESYS